MKFEYMKYALMIDSQTSYKDEMKLTSLSLLGISLAAFALLHIIA